MALQGMRAVLSALVASLSGAEQGTCQLPSTQSREPGSRAGVVLGGTGTVLAGLSHCSFLSYPAGGIPGIRARGIMEPCPCLFHQQHNEPPVAPCSSPAGPGQCPRARELQTRVGFIHGHGGSCVTGSCTRIAHPATRAGGYPCHVTTQRQHYRTLGRVRAPSPPSRLGSRLGHQGLTKAKDPSTHR